MIEADDLAPRIAAFLDAHHVMSLATVGDAGAHAASVMYARDGFTLYWTSDPQTRHSVYLEREARVTATIAPDYTDFRVIRGLQVAGRGRRLAGSAADGARAALIARYAFLGELSQGPAKLRAAFEQAGFYALAPERITLIDNSLGFGHRETLALAP